MPGAKNVPSSGIGLACWRSSAIVPVRSESARVPVGETVIMPRSRCVLPFLPSKFAIGVIVFMPETAIEPVLLSVADRAAEKVGAWKVSFRSMRWWTLW